MKITADYREKASGLIDLFIREDIKDLNEYLKSIFRKLGLGELRLCAVTMVRVIHYVFRPHSH